MKKHAIKVCGICRPEDAHVAGGAGADFIGILVNVKASQRSQTLEQAKAVATATDVPLVLLLWEPSVEEAVKLAEELSPVAIQLLADETPEHLTAVKKACNCKVWKAIHLPARGTSDVDVDTIVDRIGEFEIAGADAIVLDAKVVVDGRELRGGTGHASDWGIAAEIVRRVSIPVMLAGGIDPDNVVDAIEATDPYGVDLASGVESEKGKKDHEKIRTLVQRVRALENAD